MSHISRFGGRLLAVLVLVATLATHDVSADLKPGGFMSANVEWVASLPVESPSVGARVVRLGDRTRFYVTGVKGLTIWDVTSPARPRLLGSLPLPHWENEDVAVSADGNWVLVTHDGDFEAVPQKYVFTYVIDARDPRVPKLASTIPMGSHTVSCADDACDFVYGSEGWTWDLTDKAAPKPVAVGWKKALADQGVQFRDSVHDLTMDGAGFFMTDSSPRVLFDPRPDPTQPRLLATGPVPGARDLAYQHNNLRLRAEEWQPRTTPDDDADPKLRPGELFLANGETNFTGVCDDESGPFATWSMRDWDKGAAMTPLHTYRPVSGTYTDGNPAVNGLGCSGHWFTYRNGLVAAGWYEHGTRFLDIDQATGAITEIGFFQPAVGAASAAHWIDDEYVYTVDYGRGIDILHFDRWAPRPTAASLAALSTKAAQATAATPSNPLAVAERYRCRLAQQ